MMGINSIYNNSRKLSLCLSLLKQKSGNLNLKKTFRKIISVSVGGVLLNDQVEILIHLFYSML